MKRFLSLTVALLLAFNISFAFASVSSEDKFVKRVIVEKKITEKQKEKYEKHKTDYTLYEGPVVFELNEEMGMITPKGAVAAVGTKRVVATSEFVSGTLYQDMEKSNPVVNTIWGVAMYAAGNYIGTVGSIILEVANVKYGISSSDVERYAAGSAITFYSYGYISKLGQVVDYDGTWDTKFETEKRFIYGHELGSFVYRGETKTATVDKGRKNTEYVNQSHYTSDSYIRDRAYYLWTNNYFDEYEVFY